MLMIAEKIDQPLHGVLLPGHFFVRFDNGAFKMNIEPLRNGIERTDEWYRDFFKVEAGSDVCLVNLTKRQTAAVLRYNIANFYRDKQRYDLAEAGYRAVVKDLPQFTDAWGNLGVTLDAQGRTDDALAAFAMVKKLDPSLDRLSDNMAVIHIRSRQYQKAYDLYSKSLAQRPADPDVLYGFALACFGVKKYERAVQSIEKALAVRADFPEARRLLEKIQASM